ncbi:MAG: HD domain-containing protein [Bacteroidales bacterium]|nr:HD domain-containing protein [Bacteroidales bacterium]
MPGNDEIIELVKNYVKEKLQSTETSHNWWHSFRVWQNAKLLRKDYPQSNLLVIEISALSHDLIDEKLFNITDNNELCLKDFLKELRLPENTIVTILAIIKSISYKDSFEITDSNKSIEFQIVQDADRLDAIGAIGIARAFSYGGALGREIFNPEITPEKFTSGDEYKKSKSPTINHFYEKLLHLKDEMNTQLAKNLAEERHEIMVQFLTHFKKEWNLEK